MSPIKRGIDYEGEVGKAYYEKMALDCHPVEVKSAGLILHTKHSYLRASIDGVVFDASASPVFGLLDIKCLHAFFT